MGFWLLLTIGMPTGIAADDSESSTTTANVLKQLGDETATARTAAEPQLICVKPGEFWMGSPADEKLRRKDEQRHTVQITRPFCIAKHEVTQRQYEEVMGYQPSWFSPMGDGQDSVEQTNTRGFPVDSVTWFDALEYCNRLSRLKRLAAYYSITEVVRTGKAITAARVKVLGGTGFRLPTEAEWEYACRAGTNTSHCFGTVSLKIRRREKGNFRDIVMTSSYGIVSYRTKRTASAGKYAANFWGLHDMHGNVAEWCWDWYDASYYGKSPQKDPLGPATGNHRALRGGSFLSSLPNCRSAARYWSSPATRKYYIGFRVARNGPLPQKPQSRNADGVELDSR